MKKTLLLVFLHGFKGGDDTFGSFDKDLRALLAHALPKIDVVSALYPAYETRGDLKECVARFTEWLQNKVIDLEVANHTPSPTVDPSVHVMLCGHSMGGIVAAETLLKVASDPPVPPHTYRNETANATQPSSSSSTNETGGLTNLDAAAGSGEQSTSAPPDEPTTLFFPYIRAVVAFDTPYLGISPGVLAHGAEEQISQASTAYKAFDSASNFFGWGSPRNASPQPIANASSKALPAANETSGGWGKWGKYAAYGGAVAAIAGAAGAAYINRDQISQGFAWAGSHLEFVGCLAKGAELQQRVERVVELTRSHGVGFVDFYTALGEKATGQTKYSGAMLGANDRTFCVVPKHALRREVDGKQDPASSATAAAAVDDHGPSKKRQKTQADAKADAEMEAEMSEGGRVREYAQDTSKSKGAWVRCVNEAASDEVRAHMTMFDARKNSDYFDMVPRVRDQIVEWVDRTWYEESEAGQPPTQDEDGAYAEGISTTQ